MSGKTVTITQRRLRDLAPRAVSIVAQLKEVHVGVHAIAVTLVPAASEFIGGYDGIVRYHRDQRRTMDVGRAALRALEREVRTIASVLGSALPSFDASHLTGTAEAPDAIISDGYKLLNLLQTVEGLFQREAMVALLRAAIDEAERTWSTAQLARGALQKAQAIVREQAQVLNRELISLRRILRHVVGPHHLAYQSLRTARVRNDDTDEVSELERRGAVGGACPAPTIDEPAGGGFR